jgi:predicted  nucleic acid-binding Zn ribbon protein
VESIAPGKGVRYTANIKADSYLRNGQAVIRIGVFQNNKEIPSQTKEFSIRTSKR